MTYFLTLLLSISIIYALVHFGQCLERRWNLSRYYISPPLVGAGMGALLWIASAHFADFRPVPHPVVGRWFMTIFLFFVGFKIGFMYRIRHFLSLLVFSVFAVGLLLVFEIPSWFFFNKDKTAFTALSSVSFAWNDEWLSYIRIFSPEEEAVSNTSLLLMFMVTPIVIFLMNNRVFEVSKSQISLRFEEWHVRGALIIVLSSLSALWMKHDWLSNVMFVFDYVISMGFGIGIGLHFRQNPDRFKPTFIPTIAEIGKLSLNGFIVLMFLKATEIVWLYGNWKLTVYLFVKMVFVSFFLIVWARMRIKNHKHMVWASAIWAFTLSSPVTCMNAMRSVVDRHGDADDVVFIVPPVILWLINYPHYFIFAWLHGL